MSEKMNEDPELMKELKDVIESYFESYLDIFVKVPVLETIEKDFYARDKISDLTSLLYVTTHYILKEGIDFDKNRMQKLSLAEKEQTIAILKEAKEEAERTGHVSQEVNKILRSNSSKKYLNAYIKRELNWVIVSILSASYISAHIIMRSIFEFLVIIATNNEKSDKKMGTRIDSVPFLVEEEKKKLKDLWRTLNEWTHPTENNWEKRVCPIFISHNPMYHPELCKQSLETLENIIDFFIVIGLEKFEININDVLMEIQKSHINISNLIFFQRRLQ